MLRNRVKLTKAYGFSASSDADSKTDDKAKATDTAKETAKDTAKASDTAKATDSAKASDTGKAKATSGAAATTDTASATGTAAKTAKGSGTAEASATGTASGTGKNKDDKSKTTKHKSKTFDARLPSGGISMITPGPYDGSQYYKIGDWVTFAWNYTSLSVTPSAINVLASCSVNSATYTIAANMSVGNGPGTVYWNTNDTKASATQSLVQETYTLIVYDAGSSISATAGAGYLGVSNTFRFGMYNPQPYTPRAQWSCPSCNAAFSTFERQTMGFLVGTFAITVATFTWFVVGFGVI
ncbi:uncharacterized protein K452DRAFT_239924 [Aplosporella prunicola CBS 121167]|uniref:DUF7137 domain-containing protein n=1 Tax=Aplosporella prunicola CBS 121167 TaxID=1176127 RepID=A0A6A6ATV6_9PEZI|nr:uncharacterized protein K452DRAFT_239924 [Aplosporella prunicola CBS 121167]KAF2135120.1 hypothetical protein K452DRAFT_239924 [Aplosporella prunicola CBS 121167]